jgi:hypothetical protein
VVRVDGAVEHHRVVAVHRAHPLCRASINYFIVATLVQRVAKRLACLLGDLSEVAPCLLAALISTLT